MSEPLETHLLETFVEVVRRGSVTEAAERLNRSQPAISHRLKTLEEHFEVPLFERIGRQLELTAHGERLFEHGLDLLTQLRGLEEYVSGPRERIEGEVAIGTFPTVARHLIPEAVADILEHYGHLELTFQFAPASDLIDALQTGRVDLTLFVGDIDATGLREEPLGETRLVAAMSPADAPDDKLSLSHLRAQRYLSWTGPSDPTFDTAHRYAARYDLIDPNTPEIPQIETLRVLASMGAGFTILPDYTTRRDVRAGDLVTFPLPELDRAIPISILMREDQVEPPALRTVGRTLVDHGRSFLEDD